MDTTDASAACVCRPSGELGIALSGGGAKSLAQVGALKVLEREGVPVSYVTGTSAGAIVGAVYVTSRDARETEERVLAHLRTTGTGFNAETLAAATGGGRRPGILGMVRSIWHAGRGAEGLLDGAAMRRSFQVLLGDAAFAQARLPFATTALDLVTGRRLIFAAGPLVEAVYASAAIPGLFEPLVLGEHILVDGGWAEPVPVETCRHLGAIHVLAVDVSADREEVAAGAGAVATALRADELARQLLEDSQLAQADFVLRPRVMVRHFADFSDCDGLIAAGERAAEAALDEVVAVLERHRSLFIRAPSAS